MQCRIWTSVNSNRSTLKDSGYIWKKIYNDCISNRSNHGRRADAEFVKISLLLIFSAKHRSGKFNIQTDWVIPTVLKLPRSNMNKLSAIFKRRQIPETFKVFELSPSDEANQCFMLYLIFSNMKYIRWQHLLRTLKPFTGSFWMEKI